MPVKRFLRKHWLSILLVMAAAWWYYRYKTIHPIAWEKVMVYSTPTEAHRAGDILEGPLIVHFYATWCGPCMKELPELYLYNRTHPGNKLVLITDDEWKEIDPIADQYGFTVFRVDNMDDCGVHSIPATYFLNGNLEMVQGGLGSYAWNDSIFQQQINHYLAD